MWLTRMELENKILERQGILDSYAWHQHLWTCFPSQADQARDFLSRIDHLEGRVRVWVLSRREPMRPSWCPSEAFQVKQIAPGFLKHRRYAFDLLVNPTRAIKSFVPIDADGSPRRRTNGKRPSGKRIALTDPTMLREWLERKAAQGGFVLSDLKSLEIGPIREIPFRKRGINGQHSGVQFRGVLEVIDPICFEKTYHAGIGSAKAFGYGLLLLVPLHD